MVNRHGHGQPYKVSLLGRPLGHTVSPAMHNAAAFTLGIDLVYGAVEVDALQLPAAVAELRGPTYLGANVTLPHKQAMLALVDAVSPLARRIGALNTVHSLDGTLLGENTDAPALLRCLHESMDLQPRDERVLLLGAGGAARAAAIALADAGVAKLEIWNRTTARAEALLAGVRVLDSADRSALSVVEDLGVALSRATLVVNATSAGLDGVAAPVSLSGISSSARLFDMVYGPDSTPLVRAARSIGLHAVDGLWMLVYQASASFALWTGKDAPEAVMHDAATRELGRRRAGRESRAGSTEGSAV